MELYEVEAGDYILIEGRNNMVLDVNYNTGVLLVYWVGRPKEQNEIKFNENFEKTLL